MTASWRRERKEASLDFQDFSGRGNKNQKLQFYVPAVPRSFVGPLCCRMLPFLKVASSCPDPKEDLQGFHIPLNPTKHLVKYWWPVPAVLINTTGEHRSSQGMKSEALPLHPLSLAVLYAGIPWFSPTQRKAISTNLYLDQQSMVHL